MIELPDSEASRAVLIGVHAYECLDDLPAVQQNLTGLRQALCDPALLGLPEANCVVLEQPRGPRDVLDQVRRVAMQTGDTLVVYYAGHGLADPYTDELCLTLPDSDPAVGYTTLRYEDLRRIVVDPAVRAQRKVVILDCCYSGRALLGGMSASAQVADQAVVQGSYLLTASAETRKALAPPGERYTAFTGELLEVLRGGVVGGPELLDMDTIYRRVHTALAAKSRPLPQQRNRNTGGLIPLVRNAAVRGPRSALPVEDRGPRTISLRDVYADASKLARPVIRTLGPAGSVVVLPDGTRTSDPALIVDPGLAGRNESRGLGTDLIRALVRRMRAEWADGAATATTMADAMMASFSRSQGEISPARSSMELGRLAEPVRTAIREAARELETKEQVAAVVLSATGSEQAAELLAEALDKVGKLGVVTVVPSAGRGMQLEVQEGMFLRNEAYSRPGDFPDQMLTDVSVTFGPQQVRRDQGSPVLNIGLAVTGRALVADLAGRQVELPCAEPELVLQDIAVIAGRPSADGVGFVERAAVAPGGLLIMNGERNADRIRARFLELRSQIENLDSDEARAIRQTRLARVAGGVCIIRVGGEPGESAQETRSRLTTVVRARDILAPLVDSGLLPGAGAALAAAARALDDRVGSPAKTAVLQGLSAPMRQILANGGYSRADLPPDAEGLDVVTGALGAPWDLGILDPARIVEAAFDAAVDTTRQFLALG